MYSRNGKSFDRKGGWSFGNKFTRNAVIFGVDNRSSSDADNYKKIFLLRGKRDTFRIRGSFDVPEKKFSINFKKVRKQFCLSLHYNGDISYLFDNGKEIFKFKANNGSVNFPTQFCLGSISNRSIFRRKCV